MDVMTARLKFSGSRVSFQTKSKKRKWSRLVVERVSV